jgi:hypothetical protein
MRRLPWTGQPAFSTSRTALRPRKPESAGLHTAGAASEPSRVPPCRHVGEAIHIAEQLPFLDGDVPA